MSRQRWSLVLILIFTVVLAACQPAATPTPTARPPATTVPPTEAATETVSVEATEVATEAVAATEMATDAVSATEAATEEMIATEAATEAMMPTEEMAATEAATEEATMEATEAVTPEVGNVIEVAAQAGDFTTLLAALDAAGLTETLEGAGPFTVFAPTDEAFSEMLALAGIDAEALLANANLANILLYHVVRGDVTSDELEGYRSTDNPDEIVVATLLEGENLVITFGEDDSVIINGVAHVTLANVEAANGVIHVIDAVLVPPADEVSTPEATEVVAVEQPTEEAAATEAATEEMLATEAAPEETVMTEAPTEEMLATEAATETAAIEVTEMATEAATAEATEVATEAVTPEETAVLVPTEVATAEVTPELGTVIEVATQAGDFTTLLAALDAADLTEVLEGDGPFTVFAPTDEAFAALLESLDVDAEALLANTSLGDILLYHVIAGDIQLEAAELTQYQSEDNPDEYILPTVGGAELTVTFDEDGKATINGVAEVTLANVEASNGVIYVIDTVLVPEMVNLEATETP